jgi:hypothetical protein
LNSICSPKALELGFQIARPFDGRVTCLHVHPDARELSRFTTSLDAQSGVFTGQIWDALVAGDKECALRSRKVFDAFCAREHLSGSPSDKSGVTAVWRELEGNNRDEIIGASQYNDVVVFARPHPPEDLTSTGLGEVLLASAAPLVLAPSHACVNPISTVVIAWKASAASARAVHSALPILAKAKTIHVLGVTEGDDPQSTVSSNELLCEYLRWHGLKSQSGQVNAGHRNSCDVLLEAAHEKLRGGLLVMGGYGHSRAREFIFGGFTRQVLRSAPMPVFICH